MSKRLYPKPGVKRSGKDGRNWFRFPLEEEGLTRLLSITTETTTIIRNDIPPPTNSPSKASSKPPQQRVTVISARERLLLAVKGS